MLRSRRNAFHDRSRTSPVRKETARQSNVCKFDSTFPEQCVTVYQEVFHCGSNPSTVVWSVSADHEQTLATAIVLRRRCKPKSLCSTQWLPGGSKPCISVWSVSADHEQTLDTASVLRRRCRQKSLCSTEWLPWCLQQCFCEQHAMQVLVLRPR